MKPPDGLGVVTEIIGNGETVVTVDVVVLLTPLRTPEAVRVAAVPAPEGMVHVTGPKVGAVSLEVLGM